MKFSAVFAAVAAAALARADLSSCLYKSATLTASASISELASCPTILGSVEVSGNEIGLLDLSQLEKISGDVKVFNSSSVTAINMPNLQQIDGSLSITALTQLHAIDFSSLLDAGELSLISLPSLATLNLNKGISKASLIELSDTAMSLLDGLITGLDTVGTLNVNNNKNISSIDLQNLQHVTTGILLSFNSDNCLIDLSSLSWASNFSIQDVSSLQVTNLTSVNGTFNVAYNSFDLVQFDQLKEIGGDLQFYANDEAERADFPSLTSIGGELLYFNNTNLEDLADSFDKLEKVKGAVNIKGLFGNLTMLALKEVDGDFNVTSTNEDFSCDSFDKLHKSKKIEGHNYECSAPPKSSSSSSKLGSKTKTSESSESGSDSKTDSSSATSGSSSSSKKSDANTMVVGRFAVLSTLAGAVLACML